MKNCKKVSQIACILFMFVFKVYGQEPNLKTEVKDLALKAYQRAHFQKPVITIIDYSLPSTAKRLWVLDVQRNQILYHTHVAHGQKTGDNHAKHFSDNHGSHQSSLGVFKTGSTYQGKHGLSLELHGLEKGVNGNAFSRRVVIHSAHYVSEAFARSFGRLGRSWGCPAVSEKIAPGLIKTIKGGSMVFIYYPDSRWLKKSRFVG